ncbi:amidohydrolase [Clostridium botulinum]|nr:amidohydrolase [Clostridium botulinum]NFI18469.1 amidohydrolase [Clostridium botulinum]NFL93713.1 amidohydrolase [Clostridium botulinum]NFN17186.1 amidohydrolase [Clostridium botulinum]NFN47377.1 amidohydrolase [Clostridium botulinum]
MNEQIYYNGYILTMEDPLYVDSIFVKDKIIQKIGSYEEIIQLKTPNTEIIDLNNKTLMPSFIDPHSHISALANTLSLVTLDDAKSFDDIINKLKSFKEKNKLKNSDWIIGFGYDNNYLVENSNPTKEILDKASLSNPILIAHASGHMGVANSLALKELDITNETSDPVGGHIGRVCGSNEPNGYMEENAFIHIASKIPQPSLDTTLKLIDKAQDIYLSYGITTVQDGLVNDNEFNLLKAMSDEKKLKVDVIGYVDLKNSENIAENNKDYIKKYKNKYKIGGYKLFLDGSPQGKTAWVTKPYESSKDNYCGYPIYKNSEVEDFVHVALNENMQLITHCNGDAAADQLLNSFINVIEKYNIKDTNRPVMIHAQLVRYDQIDEMKKINMIPSYFVAHTYYWGDIHIKNFGSIRAFRISPAKTTLDKDVTFTFHQDSPVVPPDMLFTVWCAVNRITKDGIIIGEFERISPLDALKAVTINAAYQYFEEDIKGSIKEGKLANLVILDKNPLMVEPIKIKDIKILKTIVEGETLYTNN